MAVYYRNENTLNLENIYAVTNIVDLWHLSKVAQENDLKLFHVFPATTYLNDVVIIVPSFLKIPALKLDGINHFALKSILARTF